MMLCSRVFVPDVFKMFNGLFKSQMYIINVVNGLRITIFYLVAVLPHRMSWNANAYIT